KMSLWDGKIIGSEKVQNSIKEKFRRDEIFEHDYNTRDLFLQFYKVSQEKSMLKRPPNVFMIFKAVFAIVAKNMNIKLPNGGTELSKLASSIWKGASNAEKHKFEVL